jgi:hypothetical protein
VYALIAVPSKSRPILECLLEGPELSEGRSIPNSSLDSIAVFASEAFPLQLCKGHIDRRKDILTSASDVFIAPEFPFDVQRNYFGSVELRLNGNLNF